MGDTSWWTAWGQSATAIGGLVLGAVGLCLGIYNVLMAREKHGWEKQDRAREEGQRRWCQDKVEALLKGLPPAASPRSIEVEPDRHDWAQWAHDQGELKLFRRPSDGKWFISLPF